MATGRGPDKQKVYSFPSFRLVGTAKNVLLITITQKEKCLSKHMGELFMKVGAARRFPRPHRLDMAPDMETCVMCLTSLLTKLKSSADTCLYSFQDPGWGIPGLGDFGCKPWPWLLEIALCPSYLLEPS